jgi:haloalkane dehalogenase
MICFRDLYQDEYPFDGRFYDRDGLRLHVLDEGQGSPVLMVHGNPSWSFYYRKLVLALRDRFRCLVPDHIGMGFSDKPDDRRYTYTLQSRIDDLQALMAQLDLGDDLTLVVHDWGGMIGLGALLACPERLKRLVILNTAAFHLLPGKRLPPPLRLARETLVGAYLVRGANAFARGAALVGCTARPMSRRLRDAYCAPYDSWENRIATLRFVQDIPLTPGDRAYALVGRMQAALADGLWRGVPTLICWGMRDFVFDEDYLAQWLEYLPQAEVFRFEDAGHYVLEDAADDIAPLIDLFLRTHPLPGEQG